MEELKEGIVINNRYLLKSYKGRGSFGEVWLTEDLEDGNNPIAIKIYISLDEKGTKEFEREYTTTYGLNHTNLLSPMGYGVWNNHPFLTMKYCGKGSSSGMVGKIDEYTVWKFIRDVSSGLNYLHNLSEPIIHQDIKPDNILIDDSSTFLITDFGISKRLRSTMRKQSTIAIGAGAVAYMAPERFDSNPRISKASDIWSLGASIYELITGELPFSGMGGVMLRHGADMPELESKWSSDLNDLMQACLSKDMTMRPTAEELERYSIIKLDSEKIDAPWRSQKNLKSGDTILETPILKTPKHDLLKEEEKIKKTNNRRIGWIIAFIVIGICMVIGIFAWLPDNKGEQVISKDYYGTPSSDVNGMDTSIKGTINQSENEGRQRTSVNDYFENNTNISEKSIDDSEDKKEIIEENIKEKTDEKIIPDNKLSILNNAIANNDFITIKKLAEENYIGAYTPYAIYLLQNHDDKNAESYANKAVNAGYPEGKKVLETLKTLGYFHYLNSSNKKYVEDFNKLKERIENQKDEYNPELRSEYKELSSYYRYGWGGEVNYSLSSYYLEKAAELGDLAASNAINLMRNF